MLDFMVVDHMCQVQTFQLVNHVLQDTLAPYKTALLPCVPRDHGQRKVLLSVNFVQQDITVELKVVQHLKPLAFHAKRVMFRMNQAKLHVKSVIKDSLKLEIIRVVTSEKDTTAATLLMVKFSRTLIYLIASVNVNRVITVRRDL
jgi:hypothetical protein